MRLSTCVLLFTLAIAGVATKTHAIDFPASDPLSSELISQQFASEKNKDDRKPDPCKNDNTDPGCGRRDFRFLKFVGSETSVLMPIDGKNYPSKIDPKCNKIDSQQDNEDARGSGRCES